MTWLLAGGWQLEIIRINTDKGRCLLRLGEEDVKYMLLDYLGTRNWRITFPNQNGKI
jgi:hypothetical protein